MVQSYMKKVRITYGLLSPLFLIAGICIYLLFRDVSNLVFFSWMPLPEFIKPVFIELPPSIFSSVLKFNTAGMLWFVSGILFLRFIWFFRTTTQKIYIWAFCGIAVLFEIGQLSAIIPGTFDVLDLLFMGIGAFVESLLHNFYGKRRIV